MQKIENATSAGKGMIERTDDVGLMLHALSTTLLSSADVYLKRLSCQ